MSNLNESQKFSLPQDSRLNLHPDAGPNTILELREVDEPEHVGPKDVHLLSGEALVTNQAIVIRKPGWRAAYLPLYDFIRC